VKLSENPVFHDRSKHIEIKYYFIRDKVQKGEVILQYISTDEQTTDIFDETSVQDKVCIFEGQDVTRGDFSLSWKGGYDFLSWEGELICGIMDC